MYLRGDAKAMGPRRNEEALCLARLSSISSTFGVTAVSAAPMLRAAFRSVVRSDSRTSRVPLSNKR